VDNGVLKIVTGVALVEPAEFVIVTIQQIVVKAKPQGQIPPATPELSGGAAWSYYFLRCVPPIQL
jgi:hypothetical protein